MTYAPAWTQQNASGRLEPAVDRVRAVSAAELADAVNRRRRLTYREAHDYSPQITAGLPVRLTTLATAEAPPLDNLRDALAVHVLEPPPGGLGGDPPTPAAMEWLWPEPDGDEGKVIVPAGAGAGEVALPAKLNGTEDWTDPAPSAGTTPIRAVHWNELRQAVEWLRRGRWVLPVYLTAGVFSVLPDTPWTGDAVANNGTNELRAVGFALLRTGDDPPRGLTDVTVLDATGLELTADLDCKIEAYRCKRPLDFVADPPTWNEYAPASDLAWQSPGGTGPDDAERIGTLDLSAGEPSALTGPALASACQAMVGGAEQSFLFRRADTGPETVGLIAWLTVAFELNAPPN